MRKKRTLMTFILIAYFAKLEFSLAAKMWRYYLATNNDHGYITTKTKFILEYTGSAEWSSNRWYSEEHCHIENQTSPLSTVICSISGYHPFGILDQTLTKLDLENILVTKSLYCYEWKMALLSLPVSSSYRTFKMKFRLWIKKMDEVEQNNTNPFPSEVSKHITKLFYQIGQRPSVFAFVSHSSDGIAFLQQEVAFSANESVWEVELALETLELLKIKVEESTVGFLDCFTKEAIFEIQDRNFSFAESLNVTKLSYENLNDELELIQNDCAPNVFVVVRKDHLLLTKDYFDKVLALTVPGHLVTINPTSYKAVFTRQGSIVIHTGRETFIVDNNSSQIASVKGLPLNEFKFSSYPWCQQNNLPHETIADTVVAWANQSSIFLSLNSTIGFLPVNVPSFFQDQDFRLLDVKINGICHCIFYLIESSTCPECNGSKVIGYTTQQYETNAWENVTLLLEEKQFDQGLNWSFQFLPPNSLSLLVWNSRDVFYKSSKDEATVIITKKGNVLPSGDTSIVQVVTSNNGEYLVLYEDYSLFYGRIGVDYMVQLNSSFPEDVQIRFLFDLFGNAYVVSLNTSFPAVTKKNFALDNKIFNALYPDVYCPFIEFSFGNLSSSNVLDRWEQFEIWGYLAYKRSYSNDVQLIWNPTDDLLLTVSERKEYYQDVIMLSKTFTFKERKPENSSVTTSSSFSVTLLPKLNSMTCKRPFHKVFHFHAGCPPTRRSFIRDARSPDRAFSQEQEVFSLRLSSGEIFYPAIFMYDENVFIRKVYSIFQVVEINARTDFAVRVEQGINRDMTIMSFDGSTGSFRFSLRFEDKNISFCETILEFDVHVEEERVTNYFYVEFACVTLITILFFVFLVFNYMFYRKQFLQRHEEDDEAKNRLQELQYLARLQYYRAGGSTKPTPTVETTSAEETKRRAALITGKNERRGNRRSSVFERVSKGVFEDLKVEQRSKSLHEAPPETEDPSNLLNVPRRNTSAQ